ncbi:MAG: type II toxin-antitoxin system RelE/ParE family toxin [Chromatiaceae bacterium]|nr:type II toxin-antitoxin system RelE/ParE family toxin [Chromatiaceae bacterium]
MFEILKTDTFDQWLRSLRDRAAVARINARLRRAALGHLGDCKPVGEGVSEMRVFCGPGYHLYFTRKGSALIVLLCGGDKSTQLRDIERAKAMASDWSD